jgi:hypothetical protein
MTMLRAHSRQRLNPQFSVPAMSWRTAKRLDMKMKLAFAVGVLMCAFAGPALAVEGTWVRDAHFTFLKIGSCARIYRCVAPDQVQAGARHFTVSSPKRQPGMCTPGVDSADYCGLCETDAPKERCTYSLK